LVKLLHAARPDILVDVVPHAWFRHRYRRVAVAGLRGPRYRVGAIRGLYPILAKWSHEEDYFPGVADDFDYWLDAWMAGGGGPPAAFFMKRAELADLVLFNGENTNYRNTVEARRACFLLYLAHEGLRKPAAVVNVTVHVDTVLPILRGMLQKVYPKLDLVATREPRSWRNLEELGVTGALSSADVVFGLRPPDYSRASFDRWARQVGLQKPYFCLSTSGLPASEPRGSWDGEVANLVRALQRLAPNAVLVAKDGPNQFMQEVAKRTGAVFFGPEHEFHELWPLFQEAELLVSGHFHYVIFAAMVGCPFVPLSANNHKMAGLCEQLDWPFPEPFDVTFLQQCGTEVVAAAEELLGRRRELSSRLLETSGRLAAEVTHTIENALVLASKRAGHSN